MKILIDTSVLISGSILWEFSEEGESFLLKHRYYPKCDSLFNFLRANIDLEIGIITKTVENEAKNALRHAVLATIRETNKKYGIPDFVRKFKIMVLQNIISNESLDRMEKIIEECSVRLPIDTSRRDEIKIREVEPFLKELVKSTVRYIQPHIPKFIKGKDARSELTDIMLESIPSKGIVYKGMPEDKDLVIMTEAAMIWRKYDGKEKIFVASVDKNFIPNPIQVGSYLSGYKKYIGIDPTVRDKLAEKFGFVGEEPTQLMETIKKEFPNFVFP